MYGIPAGSRLVKLTLVNGCKLDYMFAPYDFRGNFINAVFGGTINVQYVLDWDYHSDDEQWHDVKRQLPPTSHMVWAACPNVVLCAYQTFLLYLDSDGQWRDDTGCLFSRKVNFWQYADVPECNISC